MFLVDLLLLIVPLLLAMAFLTLTKQKMLGYMQLQKSPNVVGPYGLLQMFADAVKLLISEPLKPLTSSIILFIIAPSLALTLAFTMWILYPCHNPH